MSKLNKAATKEWLSVPTADGQYRYVFTYNENDLTPKGIPHMLSHKLINSVTGATLVGSGGRTIFCAPSWDQTELTKKMLGELRAVSARLFFKLIARKPALWDAWSQNNLEALRGECLNYVLVEEVIDNFFANVMKTERLRKPNADGYSFVSVKSSELIRGEFAGHVLSVTRNLSFFGQPFSEPVVQVTYDFRLPFTVRNEFDPGQVSLKFLYPLQSWPLLKKFLAEPRVAAVLQAWIDSWPEGIEEKSKTRVDF